MSTETPLSSHGHLWDRLLLVADEVESLQQRVEALEKGVRAGAQGPRPKLGELEKALVQITKELFPGEVSIRELDDPENPGDSYTVVEAKATGAVEDIVDRRIQWHQRVAELSDRCRSLCLSLSDAT